MQGKWKNKKVAVLFGGISKEREISLRTGAAIVKGLRSRGYNVSEIDAGDGFSFVEKIKAEKPDVALIALHGKFGEDGCVQGLLEILKIPYTGGGVLASALGMDKVLCSKIARAIGIICPEGAMFDAKKQSPEDFVSKINFGFPVIVKPSREGSTINVTIVHEKGELIPALRTASVSDSRVVVEQFVTGKEVTVGILNGRALPVLEIAPKSGFYDFTSKYTKGMTEYIVPARISEECQRKLRKWTEEIYAEIDCSGTARADYIVTEDDRAYFLEINTIPGMTELSLVPKAAAHEGLSFEDVCEALLDGAALKTN